ncbi:MAG: sugar phosphate isomerase/epimerase [Clostridia bacterium]|nr:sugar phosphate isomerase/epimerase [Clostridia bacterium]
MKTSVSTYSFGSYRELGMEALISKAKEMGFDGMDFLERDIRDLEHARALRAKAEEEGIAIVALCVGADFIKNGVEEEIARLKGLVDIAAALGARLMRHDITAGDKSGKKVGISYDALLPTLAAAVREVAEYAQSKGVRTMTENHGYFSQDADRVEKLINAVNHENFGALVDIGNFMCADEDPWKSVGVMAPYAYHVHVKDFHKKSGTDVDPGKGWFRTRGGDYLRGAIIGHGDARAAQSLHVLKKSGYDGYLTVEFEGMEDNLKGIELGRENMIRFWGE